MTPTNSISLTSRRSLLLAACATGASGCFGSFLATRKLLAWNEGLGNKWINWLAFVGLSIIPVYPLFVMADTLVLNSVEFWTGSNPLSASNDGRTIHRVAQADPSAVRVEVRRGQGLEYAALFRIASQHELVVQDEQGRVMSRVTERSDGSLDLSDGQGQPLAHLRASGVRRVVQGGEQGQSVLALLQLELGQDTFRLASGVDPGKSTTATF